MVGLARLSPATAARGFLSKSYPLHLNMLKAVHYRAFSFKICVLWQSYSFVQAIHPDAASIMDRVNQYFSVALLGWVGGSVESGQQLHFL